MFVAKTQSDAAVMARVDVCEQVGSAAGLAKTNRKRWNNAVYHLTTEGHLVYVAHTTKGRGWIRTTSLERYQADGWVLTAMRLSPIDLHEVTNA